MPKKRKKHSSSSAVQRQAQIKSQARLQRSETTTTVAAGSSASSTAESKSSSTRAQTTKTTPAPSPPRNRQARRRTTRSYRWWVIGGALVAIAIIIGAFVLIAHQPTTGTTSGSTDPEVLNYVSHVDPALLEQVGTGGQTNPLKAVSNRDRLVGPHGKPEIFYWGAEFCPYCAAERWPMVVALSRFGSFSKLPETTSSSTDVDPNTATFTFHGSVYSSQYVDFVPLEVEDRDQNPLQTPTADQQQLVNALNPDGGFPFVDIANIYISQGQAYDPQVLSGLSQKDIAIQMTNTSTTVSKSILGIANYFTAAICVATGDQPASVCKASFIQQIEQQLPRTALASAPQMAFLPGPISEGGLPVRPRSALT